MPVFSVDTEVEAQQLIVMTCPRGLDGKFYARELMEEQTLENLQKFSDQLQRAHDRLKSNGRCECKEKR